MRADEWTNEDEEWLKDVFRAVQVEGELTLPGPEWKPRVDTDEVTVDITDTAPVIDLRDVREKRQGGRRMAALLVAAAAVIVAAGGIATWRSTEAVEVATVDILPSTTQTLTPLSSTTDSPDNTPSPAPTASPTEDSVAPNESAVPTSQAPSTAPGSQPATTITTQAPVTTANQPTTSTQRTTATTQQATTMAPPATTATTQRPATTATSPATVATTQGANPVTEPPPLTVTTQATTTTVAPPQISIQGPTVVTCSDDLMTIRVLNSGGPIDSYNWNTGRVHLGSPFNSGPTATVKFDLQAGSYSITVTVNGGVSASLNTTVVDDGSGCVGFR